MAMNFLMGAVAGAAGAVAVADAYPGESRSETAGGSRSCFEYHIIVFDTRTRKEIWKQSHI